MHLKQHIKLNDTNDSYISILSVSTRLQNTRRDRARWNTLEDTLSRSNISINDTIHILESAHISSTFSQCASGISYHRHSNLYYVPSFSFLISSFSAISLSFYISHRPSYSDHTHCTRTMEPLLNRIQTPTYIVCVDMDHIARSKDLERESNQHTQYMSESDYDSE